MASTKELEYTLPLHDSPDGRSSDILDKQWPIYPMVAFEEQELEQLEHDINKAEDSTDCSVLITQPDFSVSTLRDVYEHHMHLRNERQDIHPSLFIAVDQKGYKSKGVLVVDLQVMMEHGQSVIGVLRCGYDDADMYCANLDIGNMSFIDYKEEEQRLWHGDNPYENHRYFPKEPDQPAPLSGTFSHYAWYSNVEMGGPIQEFLEPGWVDMKEGESRLHRAGGWFNALDPWHEIRRRFPFRCLQQPELHRILFLVAEKEGDEPDAIAICKAQWDGDLRNYHYDSSSYEGQNCDRERVFAIMPEIVVEKRVSPAEALAELDRMGGNLV